MFMEDFFELAIEELRIQRHDFMNYMQVIFGYIQINKPDNASEYIKKINSRMITLSRIFNLESSYLGILLQNLIGTIYKLGAEIIFENEINYIDKVVFSKNITNIKLCFETVKLKLEKLFSENFSDTVFINISGTAENFSLQISNYENTAALCRLTPFSFKESLQLSGGCSLELFTENSGFCYILKVFDIG